ncbi:MAG: DUF167 domain-containing protein [Leptospiraceae bacterium]|nr:DUF167 domain-containing protein [Leptospiraceae bacterium]
MMKIEQKLKATANMAKPTVPPGRYVIHGRPGSRQPGITENTDGSLTVRVSTIAADGKANKAIIKALAKHWHVAQSRIQIIQGATQRTKLVQLASCT